MAVDNMRSVKLKTPQQQQLSPQTKASDILFADGIDLQTKYVNGTLVDKDALTWVHAVSPTVTVVKNTSTEFRLQIKAINSVITTPNLKGATAEELAAQIQDSVAQLETRIANLVDRSELNAVQTSINTVANNVTSLRNTINSYDSQITTIRNKVNTNTNKITEIEEVLENKADKSEIVSTYSKSEINSKLEQKVDAAVYAADKETFQQLIDAAGAQEYVSLEAFPVTGEAGKLYVDTTEDMLYRWDEEEQKYTLLCGNNMGDALTDADIDTLF